MPILRVKSFFSFLLQLFAHLSSLIESSIYGFELVKSRQAEEISNLVTKNNTLENRVNSATPPEFIKLENKVSHVFFFYL